jgi:hypothetical protein
MPYPLLLQQSDRSLDGVVRPNHVQFGRHQVGNFHRGFPLESMRRRVRFCYMTRRGSNQRRRSGRAKQLHKDLGKYSEKA